jgi:hypothetical protein
MDMKRRRKAGILSLCVGTALSLQAPLMSFAASPEFARTSEEWARLRDNVLEYDELADLIHEYNVTTQKNQYTASQMDSDLTLNELVGDQLGAAQQMYQAAANATTEYERITAEVQARQAELGVLRSYDSMTDADSLKWQNARTEGLLVQEAQNTMNSYYQLKQQLIAAEKGKELLEAQLTSTQTRVSLQMATQAELLSAQQSLQNAEAQILSLKSDIESTRQKLIIMTGWKQSDNPEIREIPEVDFGRITAIDPARDLETALANDYQLKLDKNKSTYVPNKDYRKAYEVTVDTDKEQIANVLNNAYQAVLQAKTAYDEAVLALDVATRNMATASNQYGLGSISLLEYRQADNEQVTAQTGLEIKKLALLQALEAYDWIVKGVR